MSKFDAFRPAGSEEAREAANQPSLPGGDDPAAAHGDYFRGGRGGGDRRGGGGVWILIGLLVPAILIGLLLFLPTPTLGSFFDMFSSETAASGAPVAECGGVFTLVNQARTTVGSGSLCPGGSGETCGVSCDPQAANSCGPGLSCQQEPDGAYVCWGTVCSQPTGGTCGAQCDPQAANPCGSGLNCQQEPDGAYVCWAASCSQSTGGQQQNAGACLDSCDPALNNCLGGLNCVPRSPGSSDYICYNNVICNPNVTQEPTEAVGTEQACVCGDGVCEQARCQEFTQNCPADCGPNPGSNTGPTPDLCAKSCGNGVCEPNCNENPNVCPADCAQP